MRVMANGHSTFPSNYIKGISNYSRAFLPRAIYVPRIFILPKFLAFKVWTDKIYLDHDLLP